MNWFILSARLLKKQEQKEHIPSVGSNSTKKKGRMFESNNDILTLFRAGRWQYYYLFQVIRSYKQVFKKLGTDPETLAKKIPASEHPVYTMFLVLDYDCHMLIHEILMIIFQDQLTLPIPGCSERRYSPLPNGNIIRSLYNTPDPTTILVPLVNMNSPIARYGKPGCCTFDSFTHGSGDIVSKIGKVIIPTAIQLHKTRKGGHNLNMVEAMIAFFKFSDAEFSPPDKKYPYRVKMQCPKGISGCEIKECNEQLYLDEILAKLRNHISYLEMIKGYHMEDREIVYTCTEHIGNTNNVIRALQNKFNEIVMKAEEKYRQEEKIALVVKCPNRDCDDHWVPCATPMPGDVKMRSVNGVRGLKNEYGRNSVYLCQTVTCQSCVTPVKNDDGTEKQIPTTFCSLCSGTHSYGTKCLKTKRYTPEEEEALVKLSQECINQSFCPWCKEENDEIVPLERSSGCPKLTCGECRRYFCCVCNCKIEPNTDYVSLYFANDRNGKYVCRMMFLLFAIQNKEVKETFDGIEIVTYGDMRWIIGTIIYSASMASKYNSSSSEMQESIRNRNIIDVDGTITIGVIAIAKLCEVFGTRDRTYGREPRGFSFLLNENLDVAKKVVDLLDNYTANEVHPHDIPERLEYEKFKEELTTKLEEEYETLFGKLFDE